VRSALIAALLGSALVAVTPAAAEPVEPNETSVLAAIDSFVAYLKSETNQTVTAAARLARDNKESLAAAKSYLDSQLSGWRDLLSDQKARAGTLGKDAAASWEAWREAAVASWAAIERQAVDALDWIQSWMRNQSMTDQNPETPV
jgi:hypothetical protein